MNITIIGTGNVGTVLGRMLSHAGHHITALKGRGPLLIKDADLVIIAIPDEALTLIGDNIKLDSQLIVHTAGSVSINVLRNISDNYGVFYPLQSIRKEIIKDLEIPFLIDANTLQNKIILQQVAKGISRKVEYADDQRRLRLHVAAVITNNFTNHLYALTEEFCKMEQVDFSILYPLLHETVSRVQNNSAAILQTGPASRNDYETIQKQKDMLSAYPQLSKLYDVFTESIINYRFS